MVMRGPNINKHEQIQQTNEAPTDTETTSYVQYKLINYADKVKQEDKESGTWFINKKSSYPQEKIVVRTILLETYKLHNPA